MSRLVKGPSLVRQPQIVTGVDRSNPIARELDFAYNGAVICDCASDRPLPDAFPSVLVRAFPFPLNASTDTDSGYEIGVFHNGVNDIGSNHYYLDSDLTSTSISLFARCYLWDSSSDGTIFTYCDTSNDVGFELSITSSVLGLWAKDTAGWQWVFTDGPNVASGDLLEILCVVKAGSPIKIFTNVVRDIYTSADNYQNDVVTWESAYILNSYNRSGMQPLEGAVSCAFGWNRALSDDEAWAIIDNPWQIFSAPRQRLITPIAVVVQTAYPISDVSNSGWVASSGSDLYPMIGESVRNDSTYIYAVVPGAICEEQLTALGDPDSSVDHLPTLVLSAPGGGGITVRLREGTTTIASWTYYPPSTPTEYQPTLTGTEANSIGSYSALKYQIEAIA
jgi:hypothetical protein